MEIETAIKLISHEYLSTHGKSKWTDLGCGKGLFTQALAHHLPVGSEIFAVDKDKYVLKNLPETIEGVSLHQAPFDFTKSTGNLSGLDGILMANSFHYVRDKGAFIEKWEKLFISKPQFLIVEYDTSRANSWVPFPIKPLQLERLFSNRGYTHIEKLREIPSLYHNKIYATLIIY